MQALERKKTIGGHEFTARQPSLLEVINFFDNPPEPIPELDIIDTFLVADLDMVVSDLLMLSDATLDNIKALTEDEIGELATLCKEANPRFFQLRSQMLQAGREIAGLPPES
jgi:hypothetical protein